MTSPAAEPTNKIAQTYVWSEGKRYFVSTINRASSAMCAPGDYAETMVWEWPEGAPERGELICNGAGAEGSIFRHLQMVGAIWERGIHALTENDDD